MPALTNEFLPKTMQAVICRGPEDYRLEEWDVPTPGPGEVVIRVGAVGICASDLKCYLGAPLFWGDKHRKGYCQPPVIPGHEFVGDVVALGEGAGEKYGLAIGDRAISEQIAATASAASIGCARCTTSTASASAPSAPWPNTCSSLRVR